MYENGFVQVPRSLGDVVHLSHVLCDRCVEGNQSKEAKGAARPYAWSVFRQAVRPIN